MKVSQRFLQKIHKGIFSLKPAPDLGKLKQKSDRRKERNMRNKILLQAFRAELAEDETAFGFYSRLSEEQQAKVLNYVYRSFDTREAVNRSFTALDRLRRGRIDFV